jgi:ABC-2 type transport system permease protein
MILGFSYFWFGVPVRGEFHLLALTMLLYIFTGLSFGLLVSTVAKTQRVAMMATLLATILPTFMLSGFIFPVRSMPGIFQWVSKIIPATHFLVIIRGVMLKGNMWTDLWSPVTILIGFALFLTSLSVYRFKTSLE